LAALLWTVYFGFLELTSLGRTSEVFPCLIVSQEQTSHDQSGYQSCAPVHETIFRLLKFVWSNATHDNIIAFGTVMIALFTLTLWWSNRRLWNASDSALRHAEKTAQRQLRAYVHIDDVVMSEMNSGYDAIIQVIVKNYGQTPARCITNTCQCLPMTQPRESDFTLEGATTDELCDLAPTQKTYSTIHYPYVFWQGSKADINAKARTFYVFGRIDYRDIFERRWWI